MPGRLEGKSAIVTGAGAGIGEAIALKFAMEGANVLLAGLPGDAVDEVADAIRAKYSDVQVATFEGDLGKASEAKACVDRAVECFGKLDVLVNNAGSIPESNETQDYSEEAFDMLLNNNIKSAYYCTQAALPHLQKSHGNIVSAGSEAGFNGTPNFTPYGGTKAFIHAFMKGVAVEQAQYGVRANCVCPGPIDTEMTRPEHGAMDKKTAKMVTAATPMGRRGTPEEMANVYAFLASDEASYVSGSLFLADGGITVAHGNIGEQAPRKVRKQPEGALELEHQYEGQQSDKTHT